MTNHPVIFDRIGAVSAANPARRGPDEDRSFQALLEAAQASPAAAQEDEVREAAKSLIASAFLIPMLASVRESSWAAGPYAPTVAERRFGPMIDQQIADRVMEGTNFALIDSIVERTSRMDGTG